MMKDECGMMAHFFFDRFFTAFALETRMEMSSSASFISPAICSDFTMPESTSNPTSKPSLQAPVNHLQFYRPVRHLNGQDFTQ